MHKKLVVNLASRVNIVVCFIMLIPLCWALADDPRSAESFAFMTTIFAGMTFSFLIIRKFLNL